MGEKRKPEIVILLRKPGNKKPRKVELFSEKHWGYGIKQTERYRVRVNGKWWSNKKDDDGPAFIYRAKLRHIIWKAIVQTIFE